MKRILYFSILLAATSLHAQTFDWLKTPEINLQFSGDNVGYNTTVDPSGNVYFTGYKNNGVSYNDVMGTIYFNKYDSAGNVIFSKEIGGLACNHSIASDDQGNIIMTLGYIQTITIGDFTLSTIEQGDHFLLVKFDAQGNMLWHKEIITPQEFTWTNECRAIDTDASGNIYVGYDNYGTSYIDKYSPAGNKLMGIEQQHVNRVTSVSVDTEGNIYAAGACADNLATYAGVPMPSPFQYNTYVVKYSSQGVYQWMHYTDDITCPEPHVVARTPDEVYYSSYLFGAFDFGEFQTEGPGSSMFDDFFIARLNSAGVYQWVREVPGDGTDGAAGQGKRNFLTLDNEGNVYFAGKTERSIDWGNGVTTETSSSSADAFVLKLDPAGNAVMAVTAGGSSTYLRADAVTVDAEGAIYMAGIGSGTATFGTFEHETEGFGYYPYLARISDNTMGTPDMQQPVKTVWPNPVSDRIFLSGFGEDTTGFIVNILGQKVMDIQINNTAPIVVDALSPGTYIIKTTNGTGIKFVKK